MAKVPESGPSPHELARRARSATGLSQVAFARLLGVTTGTVSSWEQERRQPTPHRLARALLRLIADRPEWCVAVLEDGQGRKPGKSKAPAPTRRRAKPGRLDARVVRQLRKLGCGDSARVPLDRLRAALEGTAPEALDGALLRLEAAGRVALLPPLFPQALSERERSALLAHPSGEGVLFVDAIGT